MTFLKIFVLMSALVGPALAQSIPTLRGATLGRGDWDLRSASITRPLRPLSSAPSGACSNAVDTVIVETSPPTIWSCIAGSWQQMNGLIGNSIGTGDYLRSISPTIDTPIFSSYSVNTQVSVPAAPSTANRTRAFHNLADNGRFCWISTGGSLMCASEVGHLHSTYATGSSLITAGAFPYVSAAGTLAQMASLRRNSSGATEEIEFKNTTASGVTSVSFVNGASQSSAAIWRHLDASNVLTAYLAGNGTLASPLYQTIVPGSSDVHGAMTSNGIFQTATKLHCWSTSTTQWSGGTNTCLARNSDGVVEINNGTLGTLRDMALRTVAVTSLSRPGTTNGCSEWVGGFLVSTGAPCGTGNGGGLADAGLGIVVQSTTGGTPNFVRRLLVAGTGVVLPETTGAGGNLTISLDAADDTSAQAGTPGKVVLAPQLVNAIAANKQMPDPTGQQYKKARVSLSGSYEVSAEDISQAGGVITVTSTTQTFSTAGVSTLKLKPTSNLVMCGATLPVDIDGKRLLIQNVSYAFSITFSDELICPGSNIRVNGSTYSIGPLQGSTFVFLSDTDAGAPLMDWVLTHKPDLGGNVTTARFYENYPTNSHGSNGAMYPMAHWNVIQTSGPPPTNVAGTGLTPMIGFAYTNTANSNAVWNRLLPPDYAGGTVAVKLEWATHSATGGTGCTAGNNVGWTVESGTITANSYLNAVTYDTAVTTPASPITVAGQLGYQHMSSFSFTPSAWTAGNKAFLRIGRDVADTANCTVYLLSMEVGIRRTLAP